MDKTRLMEGLGINGLYIGFLAIKVALAKHPELRI